MRVEENERNKSLGHDIAWGKGYSHLHDRMMQAYRDAGNPTPALAEDLNTYNSRQLAELIDHHIMQARLEEINLAIASAVNNGCSHTRRELEKRRDEVIKNDPVIAPALEPVEDDPFRVETPR